MFWARLTSNITTIMLHVLIVLLCIHIINTVYKDLLLVFGAGRWCLLYEGNTLLKFWSEAQFLVHDWGMKAAMASAGFILQSSARIYKPSFRENKPKTLIFSHAKRPFWACFAKTGSINLGTGFPSIKKPPIYPCLLSRSHPKSIEEDYRTDRLCTVLYFTG